MAFRHFPCKEFSQKDNAVTQFATAASTLEEMGIIMNHFLLKVRDSLPEEGCGVCQKLIIR